MARKSPSTASPASCVGCADRGSVLLSRDDSLVKYLDALDLYGVTMGRKERDTVLRLRADIGRYITAGGYRMWLNNPFPQASGIVAVEGPGAPGEGATINGASCCWRTCPESPLSAQR
jgi:hypothetical protein